MLAVVRRRGADKAGVDEMSELVVDVGGGLDPAQRDVALEALTNPMESGERVVHALGELRGGGDDLAAPGFDARGEVGFAARQRLGEEQLFQHGVDEVVL